MTGWSVDDVPDLTGRRALVTGVTSGLGEVTARELARAGAEVVLAARNPDKLEQTMALLREQVPGAELVPLRLDLADLTSVRRAAGTAVGLGALSALDAERDAPGATITSFGDAVWWAWATVTTVGYGDRFPVTLEGRLIAFALMLVGISLVGVVTASVAAWLIANVERPADRTS